MSERNVAIRLSTQGGEQTKATLTEVGRAGSEALARIERASKPASAGLHALDAGSRALQGSLGGWAGRLGPVGTAMTALGPAGLAAAAGIGAVSAALVRGVMDAEEQERVFRRLDAVLTATGRAAGLTRRELETFAEAREAATLATAEEVGEASAILATFRSVQGESFTRAITLSQDLATVMRTDLRSAVQQVAKALEEPTTGLTALRRSGVSFSEAQRRVITDLVETGRTAEAQRIILDTLERQVGGTAEREASGLTGAANRLSDAWSNMLKEIGKTPGIASSAEWVMGRLAGGLEARTQQIAGPSAGQRVVVFDREIAEARERLEINRASGAGARTLALIEQDIARLEARREVVIAESREAMATVEGERAAAADGQADAARERAREAVTTAMAAIEKDLDKLRTEPAERIAKVRAELEAERARLEGLRAQGAPDVDVDRGIAAAEERARRQIDAIEKPAREASERLAAANAKIVDDLKRQIAGVLDERQAFVDAQLARLAADAPEDQRQQVEALATAYLDAKQRVEDFNAALEREDALMAEGTRLKEMLRTATEVHADEVERLNELHAAGAIDAETYERGLKRAGQTLRAATDEGRRGAEAMRALGVTFSSTAEDMIVKGAQARDVLAGLLQDLARIATRRWITGPAFAWAFGGAEGGGFLDTLFSASGNAFDAGRPIPFARGGVVDRPTLFPLDAGRSGVMGEAGPEAVMPLSRLRDGRLGVLAAGSGGNSFVANVAVTVNAGHHAGAEADSALAVQIGREVKRELRALWAEELVEQQRPGNLLGGGIVA
ncbi:MAG: phage tail length tape measure family protein [Alphaproteobacteria bacterium]